MSKVRIFLGLPDYFAGHFTTIQFLDLPRKVQKGKTQILMLATLDQNQALVFDVTDSLEVTRI
jgi:hypothetical protein